MGKRHSPIERSIRGVIESLESRLFLTVSTDANGWTVVTPTPGVSRLIYVSSSTGSDTNSGLSASDPVATIAHAVTLVRNDEPDWILLLRGDTFDETVTLTASGLSAQQPMVLTDYGNPALPRPIIDGMTSTALHTGYDNDYVDIIGISFTSSTADPASPNFNGVGSDGLSDSGTSNLWVEDCSFSYFVDDVLLETVTAPINNVTIRRCEVLDSYCTDGHSEGLYANGVSGLTIEDTIFDHDGWNTSVPGAGATGYNHDCYLASNNSGCVIVENVFADASSCGLQARAGGIVEDNLFVGDPYGLTFGLVNGATTTPGGVTGQVIGNVIIEPRVDNVNTWGIAMQIGNLQVGGGTVVADNIVADAPSEDTPAIEFAPGNGDSNPTAAAGLNTLVFSNNIVYDWGYAMYLSSQYVDGTTGPDGLTAVVIRNNDFQQNVAGRIIDSANIDNPLDESWSGNVYSSTVTSSASWFENDGVTTSLAAWQSAVEPTAISETVPFVNPGATIESYMGSQGLTATLAGFVDGARALSATNWNPVYQAAAVISYVQGGFSVDSSAPVATLTPPGDVTPANYQTTPSPTFTVTYTDAVAVNPATISSANITIAGAGGITLPVSLVSTSGSGASITATYEVSAPGGDWTTVPYGTYVISLAGGQVMDTSGNAAPGEPLGTFQVTVAPDQNPAPVAAATTPQDFTAVAGATSIKLSWTDPADDQQSFLLQRAADSGFTKDVQSFPLTSDATSYTDSSVAVGDTYYYQLIAVNSAGDSSPTPAVFATILPPPPKLSTVKLDDGNSSRTAITSATLAFTSPVTVNSSDISLIQSPATNPTPVSIIVSNPSGDGETWLVTWKTSVYNNALPDGAYSLTVHGAQITDAYGQTAGGDQTTNFTSADGPVVTNAVFYHAAPPHSLSFTFSADVSASLAKSPLSAITVKNSAGQAVPAVGYSWNSATLTATWTFAGALPDGSYSAVLSASTITNADGVHLDGNGDGIPGDNYVYDFTQVAPTLSASGAGNANVNAPYTLTLGAITDAGETSPQYLVIWGDGSTSTYTSSGAVTHTYTTALGPTKIEVDVVDANGTHANVASDSVSINRATVALTGNSNANPDATYTLHLGAVTDPGFTASQYIVHWGDGTTNTYTTTGAQTHVFDNTTGASVSDTITVDLVDNSGSGGASFTNLSVAALKVTLNPYPYVPVTGSLNANAGGAYELTIGAPQDPGFTVSQLVVNWGDGSPSTPVAAGGGALTHTFSTATAPNSDFITVDMTDNSGTYKSAGHLTIVVNPAPTVTLSGNSAANIEGAYVLNVSSALDTAQAVSQYTINWGDGSSTVSGTPGNFNHVYRSTGPAKITVGVTDGSGFYPVAGSLPITVNNDPTVALTGNPYANAGGAYTLNLGAVNDPGQTVSKYTVDWGDGSTPSVYTAAGAVTHTYASPGSDTISVGLTDGTGTYNGAAVLPVSVTRPTVSLTGNVGVFQGQTYGVTINPPSDYGGTPQKYVVNWGDGSSSIYMSTGAASDVLAQHVYSVAQAAIITVDLVDNTGTFLDTGALPLTVAPPPAVNLLGSANTNVGGVYTLTLGGVTDSIGTVSSFVIHWGDNTTSTTSTLGNITHVYNTAGPASIVIDTVDQTGTYTSAATLPLTVNQPTITLAGNSYAPLNQPYNLELGSVFDPGQTVTGYTVNWGDGTSNTYGAAGFVQHTYTKPGSKTLSVSLTDGIGTYADVGSLSLTIASAAAPTLTLSGAAHANAGGTYTLGLGPVSDPNGTPTQYLVHWGDGSTGTYSSLGNITHSYSTPATTTISVDITDPEGVWVNAASAPIIISPAPTVALTGAADANVGGVYTLNLGAVTDPGYSVSQYTVNWGDGKSGTYLTGGAITHTFTNPGPADITVGLTDATGTFASTSSHPITVNPAPTIALSGSATANAGGAYTLNLGAVTDPGYTISGFTVHWGDGATSSYTAGGAVTHTYAKAGPANITVDLTDSTGTYLATASHALTVNPPPTIALTGASTVAAYSVYSLTLGAVTDPGYTVSQYTVHWGDGTTSTYSAAGVVTHTYSAAISASITVDLKDSTGTYTNAGSLKLTVNPGGLFSNSVDIGSPTLAGSASLANGTYTVTGEGSDIWNASDQFHYDYTTTTGNTTISARVTSVQNINSWSKAGVMIRNGTAANAAFADVVVTPAGYVSFQYRTKAGGACSMYTLTGKAVPQYVKLVRTGNSFAAYYSSNGTAWTQIGPTVSITMSSAVTTGLAVTSLNTAKTCTATFTNVSVT